jgi:hypothetical protein
MASEQPNPHSDLPHGHERNPEANTPDDTESIVHWRTLWKTMCGADYGNLRRTEVKANVTCLACLKIMAEEKPTSDVADFFTHYMPDRESQAILCPANESEGKRWRTYDARSVTCPNCLKIMPEEKKPVDDGGLRDFMVRLAS